MRASFSALGRDRNTMNKTESVHAADLEMQKRAGQIRDYRWQPLRLKIGANCTYEPDFLVFLLDRTMEFHEVKGGFITDDAIVKLKVAANLFPWFGFRMYQYDRKGCKTREVNPL
jgi:hypothetical protein